MKKEDQGITIPTTITPKICFSYLRFSTKIQEEGTSEIRQLDIAPKIAERYGWILDEKLNIDDKGLSGFKGRNYKETAGLGALLKALKEGAFPKGRIMIVEAMDRLSRLTPHIARHLFEELLANDLEIYIHEDSKLYTKKSLEDLSDLIISLIRIDAAHKYSKRLSGLLSDSWIIRKDTFAKDGVIYKAKANAWLKYNDDEKHYEVVPEHVETIKYMFSLANMGLGVRAIANRLTKEGKKVITDKRKSNGWAPISVRRILTSKSVLGINVHVDPPAENFYPRIIDDKLFYEVAYKLDQRKTKKFYGNVASAKNLFAGIAVCSECGHGLCRAEMHKDQPIGRKTFIYLRCRMSNEGRCQGTSVDYERVETSFSGSLSDNKDFLSSYMDKDMVGNTLSPDKLKGELVECRGKLTQYVADYTDTPSKTLGQLIAKEEAKETDILRQIENYAVVNVGQLSLAEAYARFREEQSQNWNVPEYRLKLREMIRAVVNKIIVVAKENRYEIHYRNGRKVNVEILKSCYRVDGQEHSYDGLKIYKKPSLAIAGVKGFVKANDSRLLVIA